MKREPWNKQDIKDKLYGNVYIQDAETFYQVSLINTFNPYFGFKRVSELIEKVFQTELYMEKADLIEERFESSKVRNKEYFIEQERIINMYWDYNDLSKVSADNRSLFGLDVPFNRFYEATRTLLNDFDVKGTDLFEEILK